MPLSPGVLRRVNINNLGNKSFKNYIEFLKVIVILSVLLGVSIVLVGNVIVNVFQVSVHVTFDLVQVFTFVRIIITLVGLECKVCHVVRTDSVLRVQIILLAALKRALVVAVQVVNSFEGCEAVVGRLWLNSFTVPAVDGSSFPCLYAQCGRLLIEQLPIELQVGFGVLEIVVVLAVGLQFLFSLKRLAALAIPIALVHGHHRVRAVVSAQSISRRWHSESWP